MPRKTRESRSGCPIANALDVLGDRWSLLVLRDIIFEGRREFGEFLSSDEGIATNILTDRLERLTDAGLVARYDHPTDGKKYVYRVTERGADLVPAMVEIVLWAVKHLPDVDVPPSRLRPFVDDRAATIRSIRDALLAEFKSAGKPSRP